jgi:hypothetical protein
MALRQTTRPLPTQLFLGSRPNRDIRPIENGYLGTKPGGGLWTADYRRRIGSVWAEMAHDVYSGEHFTAKFGDGCHGWRLRPDPAARIYVLDTLRDLHWLQERYPLWPDTEFADGFHMPVSGDWIPQLDWPGIAAAGIDAVRLSSRGCRGAVGGMQSMGSSHWLYGPLMDWGCPSTVWFRHAFAEPELVSW